MLEQIKKPKRKKWITLMIIILIIFLIRMYLNSPYTHVEERKSINYALQGSRGDFKLLSESNDEDHKNMNYTLIDKSSYDVESIFEIRLRMNEYLENNPDYFLNNGYGIGISWIENPSGGPLVLGLTNSYSLYYGKSRPIEIIKQFETIDCLMLFGDSRKFSLSSISDSTLYEDIKGLILKDYAHIDDVEILRNFKSLEFFEANDSITDEDIKRIKEMHPNCEIYGR